MMYEHTVRMQTGVCGWTLHTGEIISFHNGDRDYDEDNMVLSFIELL
jgi:hypothetical protein